MPLRPGSFSYLSASLHCEEVELASLHQRLGQDLTPCHVYSRKQLVENIRAYKTAFGRLNHRIGYAIKANYNPALLAIVKEEGLSAVAVSGNEVRLALEVGFDGGDIFFNGSGKQVWELELAVENQCYVNVDSGFDAVNICRVAESKGKIVQVLVRLNPRLAALVHPHLATGLATSKFGVDERDLGEILETIKQCSRVVIVGIHVHLGSTIKDVSLYTTLHKHIKQVLARNHEHFKHVKIINLGGGLGVDYTHCGQAPSPADLAAALPGEPELQVMVEPGRSLVATAGGLLTSVLGRKCNGGQQFTVVDASMTDLIRPALYGAEHIVVPVWEEQGPLALHTVVGPVCETADFLAKAIPLPPCAPGSLLLVLDTGAYGAVMASNYNMRGRALEVLVEGAGVRVVGAREGYSHVMDRFRKLNN